jgi:squalene-hopene/tetraprenyl-beta-curcumene cyclase
VNDQEWAAVENDGGSVYTPAPLADDPTDVVSKAGRSEKEGLVGWKSYGSMTYAMLKSYIYIGLKKDSPEVRGAWDWISNNWSVTENPGMKTEGKFYYVATLAKTLALMGEPTIRTADGKVHNWANELTLHLLEIQNEDGAWLNTAARWMEGGPDLCTTYALRALSLAQPFME